MRPFGICMLLVGIMLTILGCTNVQPLVATAVALTVNAQTPVVQIAQETVWVTAPVTVQVTQEVEVTRLVEIIRMVEVTRLVTPIPTLTPSPAPTNTLVPTRPTQPQTAPTAVPPAPTVNLLEVMRQARSHIESFGGMIDTAMSTGYVVCEDVVRTYDGVANRPSIDAGQLNSQEQGAYASYLQATSIFLNGARDMTQNCRDFLLNPHSSTIPFLQWGVARQSVNQALNTLIPAIEALDR